MPGRRETWHGPLVALEFLTTLRLRRARIWDDAGLGAALAWFPAVGLLLGAALWGLDLALAGILPRSAAAAVLLGALALATGALHLDGVADTADGLAAPRDREARLALMREGAAGPAGVSALVLLLLAQWSALASLEGAARPAAILLAPALARWGVVAAAACYRPARPSGLGHAAATALWPVAVPLATATAAAAAIALFGAPGLLLLALAGAAALATAGAASRRLGGVTGDTHGAVVEVTHAVLWFAMLAGSERGWLAAAELP